MSNLLVGFTDTGCDSTLCEILEKQKEPVSFQDYEGIVPEPNMRPIILPGLPGGDFYNTVN